MKKQYIFSFIMAAFLMLSSCEDYLDVNNDPNNLTEVSNSLQLPANEVGIGFLLGSDIYLYSSLWIQYYAGTQNECKGWDIYSAASFGSTPWNQGYGILVNLQTIEERAIEKNDFGHAGIAQILKAYLFCVFTDIFDDIPFEEALKGTENTSPKFTSQEDIYHNILASLDEAIINLEKGNQVETLISDLIYQGNSDKWIRMANSLKLKMYLNLRLREPQIARDGINKLIQDDKLINDNKNNFNIPFGSAISAQNPIYQFQYVTRAPDAGITTRFYNLIKGDPREAYYFRPGGSGTNSTRTFENGIGAISPDADPNRLRWGKYIVNETSSGDAPMRLITSSMVYFMLAEATLTIPGVEGGQTASENYFNSALEQHFLDVSTYCSAGADFLPNTQNYSQSIISDYSNAASDNDKLNILMTEKWKTLVGNSYEAYNDYRRTRKPAVNPISNAEISYPERFPYPQQEALLNKNFPSDYVFQSISLVKKVWWAN